MSLFFIIFLLIAPWFSPDMMSRTFIIFFSLSIIPWLLSALFLSAVTTHSPDIDISIKIFRSLFGSSPIWGNFETAFRNKHRLFSFGIIIGGFATRFLVVRMKHNFSIVLYCIFAFLVGVGANMANDEGFYWSSAHQLLAKSLLWAGFAMASIFPSLDYLKTKKIDDS
jgi:hypothetical protein